MSQILRRMAGLSVLALAAAMILGGCGHKNSEEAAGEAGAAPVSVTPIEVEAVLTSEDVEVPGTVKAVRQANISAKIMAKVDRVTVDEGDRVDRGDLLVKLDDSDLRAQVSQASAGLQASRAGRKQAETALEMQRVASDAEVQQARAALQMAEANLAKVRQGPRREQREQAAQALEQAKSAQAAAQAQLDLVREGARQQQRAQAAEAVDAAEQAVEAAAQQVAAAESAARTAEADYQRMKALADQDVIPGQRLDHAEMQRDTAQAQLAQARAGQRQAQAGLEQARQQLSIVQEGARTQEVRQAEEAVAQAAAAVEQARLQLEMADIGGRSEDVATAEANVAQAREALRNAESARKRNQLREADVESARAGIGQASAGLQAARVMLDYATINAPFSGVITARHVDPGSMASPGMPLLTLEDDSSYRLNAIVPEKRLAYLHVDSVVDVVLDAIGVRWPAEIIEIVPAADPASHTFIAKAELPPDGRVHSGLFGRMVFSIGEREAIRVPDTAIWRDGSLTGVFVITDGEAELRMVQLGASLDGVTEVNSGLEDGEVIAAEAAGLTDGTRVSLSGGDSQ